MARNEVAPRSVGGIGNRTGTSFGGDQFGGNLRSAAYYANALNQLTNRTVPGYANILGAAYPSATVTVLGPNGLVASTYRRGDFFRAEPVVDNSSTALWLTLTNFGVLTEGTNADIVTNIVGSIYLPKTPEQFSYDPDGNLTNGGRWAYTWDAENRLVRMAANSGVGPSVSLKFEYDWQGRRVRKQVWGNTNWSGNPTNEVKFLYDGWNLVTELTASNAPLHTYIWGLDLSGTDQGAGGVGGLLAVKDTVQGIHFVAFDGNGSVAALTKAADGTVSAQCEYGPFGEAIRATGPMAKANPFRFSTKYQDDETDLLYYVLRYYNPCRGAWLSRDPEEEVGGINLYGFCLENPVNGYDPYGSDTRFWDAMKCMSDCIQANDPLEAVSQKVLLNLSGMKLPKTLVAKLAQIAGNESLARRILSSLKNPATSKWTSLPGTVSAVLRTPGRASAFLHGLGAGMGPFWTSYGLYMTAAEAACAGHCCANRAYDSSGGIALPINAKNLIDSAADLINRVIQNWSN